MPSAQERHVFTLVVPCYNEEEMLPLFFETVVPRLDEATGGSWRIVCVDDGSRDGTFSVIMRQYAMDRRVCGVRLSRNFGHQAAVSAGLAYASGDYIGVIDCDLQDPIEVLIDLYRKCRREGLDVCYGVRKRRDARLMLRLGYYLFYRLIQRAAQHEWPVDAGDFCVMSARCHRVLLSLPEYSRMMRGLRSWVGFRQAGIEYSRPARRLGESKYNLRKLTALAMQGLLAFSTVPLRLATIMGLAMGGFSVLFGIVVTINRLFPNFTLFHYWVGSNPGVASILVFVSFVTSVGFVCLGIIGEYLAVLLQEIKRRPTAVVESVVGEIRQNDPAYGVIQPLEQAPSTSAAVVATERAYE